MYRDVEQWIGIRHRILQEGVPIKQVTRETGISRKTVRKMLNHLQPKPYSPRSRRYPKLGPHLASIQGLLRENTNLLSAAPLSARAIYERLRSQEGFSGSYDTVRKYVRRFASDTDLEFGHFRRGSMRPR
jgi:transposase